MDSPHQQDGTPAIGSRIRLTIAYDGRPFSGWQVQPSRVSVQGSIETALAKVAGGRHLSLHGSGRTDTGVHALGQVAHFDPPPGSSLAPADWQRALNATLPPTVRVLAAAAVDPSFHARFDAEGKTYHYRIIHGPVLPPLDVGLAWHVPYDLDLAVLEEAMRTFEGEHDFRAFAANRGDASDTASAVRTIRDASIVVNPLDLGSGSTPATEITLRFEGSGFLYKMVRLLTGSAVRVALGRNDLAWLRALRDRDGNAKSAHSAIADGLTLFAVHYG